MSHGETVGITPEWQQGIGTASTAAAAPVRVVQTAGAGHKPPDDKRAPAAAAPYGDVETRTLTLEDVEWRDSGAGDGQMTVRGHAAVFNRLSLDLGGFRERIAPGAFSKALDSNPDVHALWDHDTSLVLARTKNKTLDLREDPQGLHFWARVAPTSYAADLRVLMERGDVDQASFAFTVARDEWTIENEGDDETVTRTIHEVGELFDVTVTAQGAYPQTGTEVVRSLRTRLEAEVERGNLPPEAATKLPAAAPDKPVGESPSQPPELGEDEETRRIAQELADRDDLRAAMRERKAQYRAELVTAKRRQLELERT